MSDLTRRGFLEITGAAALSQSAFQLEEIDTDPGDVEGYGLLLGPDAARPNADSQYLQQWDTYRFVYFATNTGQKSYISHEDGSWTTMPTPTSVPVNQLEKVETQESVSFFNHTFARPEAPDTKNWEFDPANVTKDGTEVELASTGTLATTQRGNYPPGGVATPGVAFRVTGAPTAGEAYAGYATSQNGIVTGEDATDSFIEIRKNGTTIRLHREEWNGYVPDERVWVDSRPVITRIPHLFYGGGDLAVDALMHGEQQSKLRRLHTFTADSLGNTFADGATIGQPNLPVRFESNGLTGGNIRANACHYQFELDEGERRINGPHFDNVDAGTTGWTPLVAWRKRAGWEMVNVKPLKIKVAASGADARLGLQLGATVSGGTWRLPENTSSSETAVEVNTGDALSLDVTGERRWPGYASAGQGSKTGSTESADLDFNLPSDRVIVLAAQGVGGTSTLSGTVGWEEFF